MNRNSTLKFTCTCGTENEAVWKKKLFSRTKGTWTAKPCPTCHKITDLSNAEVIMCPNSECKSLLLKDTKVCPSCKYPMSISDELHPVICPECGVSCYLPENHKGDHTCPFCEKTIPADHIRDVMKMYINVGPSPILVQLPTEAQMAKEGLIVYQHPTHQFPYKSQLIVNENTAAILTVNGQVKDTLSSGNFVLGLDALPFSERFDEAMEGSAPAFNVTVFCVRKKLPQLSFSYRCTPVHGAANGDEPAKEYDLFTSANLTCQVYDPKIFIAHAGYQELNEDAFSVSSDLEKPVGPLWQICCDAYADAASRACANVFINGYDATTFDACRRDFQDKLKEFLDEKLNEYGISVYTLSISQFATKETEDSAGARQDYQDQLKRRDKLKNAAATAFAWKSADVEVHLPSQTKLFATTSFSGFCRLHIADEARFFDTPEIKDFLETGSDPRGVFFDLTITDDSLAISTASVAEQSFAAPKSYFADKIHELLKLELRAITQQFINDGRITDLEDKNGYAVITQAVSRRPSGLRKTMS